jgi:DAK2 domain fusion protein YloV
MSSKNALDGKDFKNMLMAGADWLEQIVPDINALNVYPVPDGDTGTNMLLTLRASLDPTDTVTNGNVGEMAKTIDRGSLEGARGNSGVILSQVFHGLARALADCSVMDGKKLARALLEACVSAYMALSNPQEGTILTVLREAAAAADRASCGHDNSPVSVLRAAVNAARGSVMNTPNLLPVLKDAGVVDAGGHGLFTILEGALRYLCGKSNGTTPELLCRQRPLLNPTIQLSNEDDYYGFCTQFMVKGENLDSALIRKALQNQGESLIVVGDPNSQDTYPYPDTEAVISACSPYGTVSDIDIRSMDEQHQDYLLVKQAAGKLQTAVIAVVNGAGLVNAFADLGATAIVPGGQTMNPSTMDILNTVERIDADDILILPNNKNVVATALLVNSLTQKNIRVIPTRTIPQGISAMVEYNPEVDFETNFNRMSSNISSVRTVEIARSICPSRVNDLDIHQGQYIGLLDNQLLVAGDDCEVVVLQLLEKAGIGQAQLVTIYYGKESQQTVTEHISQEINRSCPHLCAGVVNGGQPGYEYIISVE